MKALLCGDITVADNRQRSSIDEARIKELQTSFLVVGQLQPICVEPTTNGKYRLIAGERRLRARQAMNGVHIRCGALGLADGEIAAVLWEDLTDLQRYEMELEENIRRVDLTWQEQARAAQRLLSLRQGQATIKGEYYGAAALGQEMGLDPVRTTGAAKANILVEVARHLDDPNVASAKTLKEAQKAVDKKVKAQELRGLAAVFEAKASRETPHRLLRGDAFEVMKALPTNSFDLILTDPPYGIGADRFGDQASTGHEYEDSPEWIERLAWEFSALATRLLKSQAHVYLFCDPRHFEAIRDGWLTEGFDVWPTPIIWSKGNGMLPKPTLGPRRTYECILFANKGERLVELVAADVISMSLVQAPRHGAEKPVGLFRDLMGRSTRPGDTVLDPFCGSGTIFPAASMSKLSATGIELNDQYADIAASRMLEEGQKSILDIL